MACDWRWQAGCASCQRKIEALSKHKSSQRTHKSRWNASHERVQVVRTFRRLYFILIFIDKHFLSSGGAILLLNQFKLYCKRNVKFWRQKISNIIIVNIRRNKNKLKFKQHFILQVLGLILLHVIIYLSHTLIYQTTQCHTKWRSSHKKSNLKQLSRRSHS